MKRAVMLTTLLLVFALAIPASAATWRNLGQAKATGNAATYDSAYPSLGVSGRNVEDVQIGVWQDSGSARNFEIDYYITAYNASGASTSRSGSPSRTVGNRTWKWFTVWDRANSWDHVSVDAAVYRAGLNSHYQGLRVKVRVR